MRRLYNRFVTKDLLYMMFGYEQVDKQITGKSFEIFNDCKLSKMKPRVNSQLTQSLTLIKS